jgi:hypothetical protein
VPFYTRGKTNPQLIDIRYGIYLGDRFIGWQKVVWQSGVWLAPGNFSCSGLETSYIFKWK